MFFLSHEKLKLANVVRAHIEYVRLAGKRERDYIVLLNLSIVCYFHYIYTRLNCEIESIGLCILIKQERVEKSLSLYLKKMTRREIERIRISVAVPFYCNLNLYYKCRLIYMQKNDIRVQYTIFDERHVISLKSVHFVLLLLFCSSSFLA